MIQATFDVPLEATIEANVSSKSNSYIGPGLIFGINHNNVFGGGENFRSNSTGVMSGRQAEARSMVRLRYSTLTKWV